jgi:signal transduction histidine kinase
VTATSQDEVGELARTFNAMAADLALVDRQRRDLVANVSHELRTPVSALRALLENLVDGVVRPDAERLQVALTQTERLGRLVTDLLDLSRLDAGLSQLNPSRMAVRPFLQEAVKEARLAEHPASSWPIGRVFTSWSPTCSTTPAGTRRWAVPSAPGPTAATAA